MAQSALATTRQPSLQREHAKNRPLHISRNVKLAVDLMVEHGKRWEQAAADVGLSARAMRVALEKPHVLKYLRERKQVFRASISAQNIHALADIRDTSDNAMAKLGAIKVLEQIDGELGAGTSAIRSPGFNIVIVNQGAQPAQRPTIDVTPVEQSADSR